MSKQPEIITYLKHILDAIQVINEYTGEVSAEEFYNIKILQDGVIRQLEIIGEAVKNIPASLTNKYSEIPWKDIAGTRDKLIHDYFSVDLETVWLTVQQDLPELQEAIHKMINNIEDVKLTEIIESRKKEDEFISPEELKNRLDLD